MRTGRGPGGYPPYGYAGAHGYESGLLTLAGANPNRPPITLQHVGERWYDPGLGRFIQRDPLGLAAGLNVYLYCGANPLTLADPDGCYVPDTWTRAIIEILRNLDVQIAEVMASRGYAFARLEELLVQKAKWLRHVGFTRAPWVRGSTFVPGIIVGICFVSAEAAHAFEPVRQDLEDLYRGWTYGGRGGFKPGELWY